MSASQDNQFKGFAKALFDELYDQFCNLKIEEDNADKEEAQETREDIQESIARRAYDFACHTVNHVSEWNAAERETELKTAEEIVEGYVPDLTELPKEQER